MNKINLKNYEAYFLDFSEGNLSHAEREELRVFLNEHPRLKKELVEFEQPLLATEESFDHALKTQLYREETTGLPMVDYLMVSQVEETISTDEKSQLAELVNKNDAILNDLAVYHKTKLTADEKIQYPNKKALLKKDNRLVLWAQAISAIAAAALIISLLNISFVDEQYRPTQFSYSAIQADDQNTITVQQQQALLEHRTIVSKVKNTELPRPVVKNNSSQTEKYIKISKIQPLAFQPIKSVAAASKALEKNVEKIENMTTIMSDAKQVAQHRESTSSEEFPTLKKLAGQKIKTGVLKNNSLKDAIIEELADLSDNRLSLSETQEGKTQRFAINIGKFSYSNF